MLHWLLLIADMDELPRHMDLLVWFLAGLSGLDYREH